MADLMTGIVSGYMQYVTDIGMHAAARWKNAMDKSALPPPNQYKADDLVSDMMAFWKDILKFDPYAPIGGFPVTALVKINQWQGSFSSAPIPTRFPTQAVLTPLYQVNGQNTIPPAGGQPAASLDTDSVSVIVKVYNFPAAPPANVASFNGLYVGLVIVDKLVVAQVQVLVAGL